MSFKKGEKKRAFFFPFSLICFGEGSILKPRFSPAVAHHRPGPRLTRSSKRARFITMGLSASGSAGELGGGECEERGDEAVDGTLRSASGAIVGGVAGVGGATGTSCLGGLNRKNNRNRLGRRAWSRIVFLTGRAKKKLRAKCAPKKGAKETGKMTAYVSRRCQESASFLRLMRSRGVRARVVTIEDAEEIPWYVDTVPSLVVRTKSGLDVYAADDAFAALEGGTSHSPPPPVESAQCEPEDEAELGCFASGEAVFEDVEGAGVVSCGGSTYESLLSKESERAVTSKTVAAWERNLRAEAECRESNTDTADKRLEMLMKARGEQQQQQQQMLPPRGEPPSTRARSAAEHRY